MHIIKADKGQGHSYENYFNTKIYLMKYLVHVGMQKAEPYVREDTKIMYTNY